MMLHLLGQAELIKSPLLWMLVAVNMLFGYIMLRMYWQRQQADKPSKPAFDSRAKLKELDRHSAISDAPVEVLRWEVEMHNTARDLKAELDTKMLALQAVTKAAQEERLRLEAVLRQATSPNAPPATLPQPTTPTSLPDPSAEA